MAITSKNINLAQLDNELGNFGLVANFEDNKNKIILPADGSPVTEKELENAIEKHVAIDEIAEYNQKRQELLNRLGITAEEAALLLS